MTSWKGYEIDIEVLLDQLKNLVEPEDGTVKIDPEKWVGRKASTVYPGYLNIFINVEVNGKAVCVEPYSDGRFGVSDLHGDNVGFGVTKPDHLLVSVEETYEKVKEMVGLQ